jgi:hypothetical protein
MNTHSMPFVRAPRSIFCLQDVSKQRSFVSHATSYPRCFAHAYISATARGMSCTRKSSWPSVTKNPGRARSFNVAKRTRLQTISGNDVRRSRGQSNGGNIHTVSVSLGGDGSNIVGVAQEVRSTRRCRGYLLACALDSENHALPIRDHSSRSEEKRVYPRAGTSNRLSSYR